MGTVDRTPWNQFLDDIELAKQRLGNPSVLWYRGHANHEWSLVPTLLRRTEGASREQLLFREYRRSADRFHERRNTGWETLVDMQHYGVPTRLLDWSEALGVAVAFAILRQYRTRGHAAIFVLDPKALNQLSGLDDIKSVHGDGDFDYQSVYWHRKPFAAQYPIALEAPFQNPRILAQRGVFTIHGTNPGCLQAQCSGAVCRVVLPDVANEAAREFLKHSNLTEYSIYPDIFGMANHIVRQAFGEGD